jgi:hypothetical protein
LNEREAATRVSVAPVQAEIAPVSIKPKEEKKEVAQVKVEPTTTLPVAPAIPVTMPAPPEILPLQLLESASSSEKLQSFVAAKPSDTAAAIPVSVPEQSAPAAEKISFKTLAMIMINTGQVTSPPPAAPVVASNTNLNPQSYRERGENLAIPAQTMTHEPSENSQTPATKAEQTAVTTAHSDSKSEKQSPVPDMATDKLKTLLSVPATKTNKTEIICYQIGVFLQQEAVNAAVNWFKKKRVTATSYKGDTRLATTTWIYLPPVRSLQLAQTTQQQLKRLGVKDVNVMTHEQLKRLGVKDTVVMTHTRASAVSLGVYRDKLGVAQRLQELRSKGFNDVRTEEHYATETKYWLSVKMASNNTTLLSQFQKAFKGLQAATVTCK